MVCSARLRIAPTEEVHDSSGRRLEGVLDEAANSTLDLNHTNLSTVNGTSSSLGNTTVTMSDTSDEVGQWEIVPVLLAVVGTCRGCPVLDSGAFNLFDDSFRRRRSRQLLVDLASWQAAPKFAQQTLNNDRNVCICPAGEDPIDGNGPATEDFQDELNDEIFKLEKGGEAVSVQSPPDNIVEGQVCTKFSYGLSSNTCRRSATDLFFFFFNQ